MRNQKSSFVDDLKGENTLGEFLDKNLYEKLKIDDFVRNSTKHPNFMNNQYKGIDTMFTFNGTKYIVDEKATLQYPDGIPTFSFELRYKKNDVCHNGWFYDERKETGYYLLAWPIRKHVGLAELQMDDIRKVEVMLIRRNDLQDYLFNNFQINKEAIQDEADKIIKNNQFGKLHTIHPTSNHYFYYTKNLAETPINLVIQKNTLKDFALFHFMVCPTKPYSQHKSYNIWLKDQFI